MRAFVKQIAASLCEDETWLIDEHWASNDKLGVKVWIANGCTFVHVEWGTERRSYGGWGGEVTVKLSLLEKIYIWRLYKKLRKRKVKCAEADFLESIIQRRLNGDTP